MYTTKTFGQLFLACAQETSNRKDPYTVCVLESGSITAGHLPRKTSAVCSMFLKKGGTIDYVLTRSTRYSIDLTQRRLEVPCSLIVSGIHSVIDKVQKLPSVHNTTGSTQVRKKIKAFLTWMRRTGCSWMAVTKLYVRDQLLKGNGQWLNDKHIYFTQCLLKSQYPTVNGLNCTLYQHKMKLDCSKLLCRLLSNVD